MRPAERLVELPEIPRKRYFAIGEVAELCEVKPHVLRYWEQEFPQLKPVKRRGNRRYYQHEDVMMVRRIRSLLYEQGFTIGGARLRLKEMPKISLLPTGPSIQTAIAVTTPLASPTTQQRGVARRAVEIQKLRSDLESLLKLFP